MKLRMLLPVAVAVLAGACSDAGGRTVTDPDLARAGGGNPHFIKSATKATRSGNNLVVTFKEAGLASGTTVTIQASATGTATYQCINRGGHNPSAANKTTVQQTVTTSGTFTADRSGNVIGSLTLTPPGPGSFTCPSGQTLTGPTNVSYSNVVVRDLTTGASLRL